MKRFILILSMVSAILMTVVPMASAMQVAVTWYSSYQSGSGGEFSITPIDFGYDVLSLYDSKARYGTTAFESFCLENNEFLGKETFDATIDNAAINGGVGGPKPDPISFGTGYLYELFAAGTLAGYDYTPGPNRRASAAALQATIWWLEGEGADPGAANIFRNAVIARFNNAATAMKDNTGAFNVAALNLTWTGTDGLHYKGQLAQSQLVRVVPEPGILLLLGLGLLGVAGIRRKF